MNCKRAQRLAHDLIGEEREGGAGRPQTAASAALEQHLWSCPACRAQVERLRALRLQLASLGGRRAPYDLATRVMAALRVERQRARRRKVAPPLSVRRAALAAVLTAALAAGGAYFALHRGQGVSRGETVSANVAPLVMEYTDFRSAQPLADHDGMALIRASLEEEHRR